MIRFIHFLIVVLLISGCSLLGPKKLNRIPLDQLEPTVRFIDQKQIDVPESKIEQVDADQVVNSYLRLMQSPHPEVRRQATRRLADLNMRLAEAKNAELADGKAEMEMPKAIREASYARAAELYQQVIDEFPKQADDASIRYQLARALALDGKSEASLQQMDSLVAEHDESPEMVEVQFRRGEAYFLRKEYRRAAAAYQRVIEQGSDTDFYDKALYKNGWSLFKVVDYTSALDNFFPLLERLKTGDQTNASVQSVMIELIKDTQRAISLSFYHLEGAQSIKEYFAKHGNKDYSHEIYDNLANLYLTQERFQDAANTYLVFVEQEPMHQKAAKFQLKVIQTYIDGGFPSLVLPAKETFLSKFGVKSEYWRLADEELRQELKPHVITNLEEVSSHYHAEAQANKDRASYLVAAEWYSHFLELLPEEKDVAPYHFLMAEALFDAGDYEKAIEAFDVIAYQYKTFEKREQAAYNILVSYQRLLEQTDKANLPVVQNYQEQSINYSLLFAEFFPNSNRAAELLLRSAEQLIVFKRLPEAIQTSGKLLALPAAKTRVQTDRAKVIIANGYFDLNQYPQAEQAITRVLTEVSLSVNETKEFRERRAQAIYQQAEVMKAAGDTQKAIAEYQRMIAVEPNASIRPNAEIDAAVLLMKLENWREAQVALEGFRGRYANHPLAEGLDERLALVYEKQELWASAAQAYERIGQQTKDPEKARDIQWYVAELYLKADSTRSAIEAFKSYFWTYPEPFLQSVEAQAKLVDLYDNLGDSEKRDFWRNKIVSSYRSGGNKNNDRTRYLAAKSAFELAEPLYQEFQAIRLTLPLAKSLKKKRAAMDKALAEYGQIAKYKVAEFTTASTHRVGQLYLVLAKDIMNSERPKGMDEDELEEYNYLIEDQAFPIEEKAIEIFASNAGRVLQDLYDVWIKRSFAELAKLQPARYDKQEVVESWFGGEPQ